MGNGYTITNVELYVSEGECSFFGSAFSVPVITIVGLWLAGIIILFIVLFCYFKKKKNQRTNIVDMWEMIDECKTHLGVISQLIILIASFVNSIIIVIPNTDDFVLTIRQKGVIMGIFSIVGLIFISLRVWLDYKSFKKQMISVNSIENKNTSSLEMTTAQQQTLQNTKSDENNNSNDEPHIQQQQQQQQETKEIIGKEENSDKTIENINLNKSELYTACLVSFIGEMFDLIIAILFYNGTDIVNLSQAFIETKEAFEFEASLGYTDAYDRMVFFGNVLEVVIIASFTGYIITQTNPK